MSSLAPKSRPRRMSTIDRLIVAQCATDVTAMMIRTIVILVAVRAEGSTGALAVVVSEAVPRLLVSLAPNSVLDHLTTSAYRSAVLVTLSLLAASMMFAAGSVVWLAVLLAIRTFTDAIWNLSIMRGMSDIAVDPYTLKAANARLTLWRSPIVTLGIALGGVTYQAIGAWGSMLLVTGVCLLALVLVRNTRATSSAVEVPNVSEPPDHALLRRLAVLAAANATFAGLYNVIVPVVFLINRSYSGLVFGLVMAAYGIGVGAAAVALRRFAKRLDSRRMLLASALSSIIGVAIIAASSKPLVAALGVVFVGVSSASYGNGFRLHVQQLQSAGAQRSAAFANGVGSCVLAIAAGVATVVMTLGPSAEVLLLIAAALTGSLVATTSWSISRESRV